MVKPIKHISCSLYSILLFYLPWGLLSIIAYFFIPYFVEYAKEALAFLLFTTALFCIFLLIPIRLKKTFYGVFLFCLCLSALFKLCFYSLFGVKISASALYVIFETNTSEAGEFLSTYFNTTILLLVLCFLLPLVFFFIYYKKWEFTKPNLLIKLSLLLIFVASCYGIYWKFSNENLLLQSISSYRDYQHTKAVLKSQLATPTHPLFNLVNKDTSAATYVIVIGESTTSWHMQIYGYPKATNPLLSEIRDELFVFDSVISPHVHTILALEKIMTLANFKNPKPQENASIVQLANAAGFETFWVSNQQPVGIHESVSTLMASAAKHQHFVATEGYQYTIYDEALLPIYKEVLNHKASKKIIFLHLIGTHVAYHKRYPKDFNFFTEPIEGKSAEQSHFINTYDNATRYNDYIIRTLIETLRNSKTPSGLLYFSDHGDDVFDVHQAIGHNEYVGSKPMYEVPFLLWFNEANKSKDSLFLNKNTITKRRYNLEDFIHTFSDLIDVDFKQKDPSRSILNTQFIKHPRLIKEGLDYDAQ